MASTADPHPIDASLTDDARHGRVDVAAWARDTARAHGIACASELIDTFVDAATHLTDARIQLDDTELLLLALARRGTITDAQRFALHAAHLRQPG